MTMGAQIRSKRKVAWVLLIALFGLVCVNATCVTPVIVEAHKLHSGCAAGHQRILDIDNVFGLPELCLFGFVALCIATAISTMVQEAQLPGIATPYFIRPPPIS